MGTRADNNEGSCREIKTGRQAGKWRVQYIVTEATGRKRRLSRVFPTQKDGKAFLRELKRSDDAAALLAAKALTLDAWVAWLDANDWPESLADATRRARMARYGKYAKRRWGGVPLARIDPLEVKAFYAELRDDGVSQSVRKSLKTDLVRIANQAVSPYRRMPSTWGNPFRIPVESAPRRDAVALTPEQARKALAARDLTDEQRAMLGLFVLAGLRLGEQMAITRGQIDFERGLVRIDRAVRVEYGGRQSVGLPKKDKVRDVVLCETLAQILRPVCEGLAPDDYLFPGTFSGEPRMKKLVYATWRTVLRDARLPADMSPQDGRLSHLNWLEKLCPDVSETTYKEHIGHATEGVTQTNYTRAIANAQAILRTSLDALMGAPAKRRKAA